MSARVADPSPAQRAALGPGAVNAVHADLFREALSGMLGFACVDADLGTAAVVDSRLSPEARQATAARLLEMLDGRSAPAFAWLPVSVEDGVRPGSAGAR